MYLTQKRVIPRWNEWVPLATQQFRLRNLVQILAMNVGREDLEGRICGQLLSEDRNGLESYYYSLHLTAMSAPFYTSEKLQSDCPKWKDIDLSTWAPESVFSGTEALVIRLWCHHSDTSDDEVISVSGIHLSGLVLIGRHLGVDMPPLKTNSIVFLMPGGYYTLPQNVYDFTKRFTSVSVAKEDVRLSYSISMLNRLNLVQMSIYQKAANAEALKQKIALGDYITQCNRGSAMLRRILNRTKSKSSHLDFVKIKESTEGARFRVKVLNEEKTRLLNLIKNLRDRLDILAENNSIIESSTMEKYRLLRREVQAHREWLKGHIDRREGHLHARALLNFRIKQLISELCFIYPIDKIGENKFTICGVHLPDSENFSGHDDLKLSVALGFVAHTVQMISVFLQVPLRYSVVHIGSRSRIMDDITEKIPDSEREFPLFCKGKDRLQFNYAVYLLNKNVAQLRCLCGLGTYDLRCTLANISSLLRLGGPDSQNNTESRSPSSSTLDLVSSSFNIPSSLDNCSHLRLPISVQCSSSPEVAGSIEHKKRDGITNLQSKVLMSSTALPNNLSYSLDKGLNEFEELKRKTGSSEAPLTIVPSNLGGSDSSLAVCLPRENPTSGIVTCIAEDAATSLFLKKWELEANCTVFSDEDSDINHSGMFTEKSKNSIDVSQRRSSEGVTIFDVIADGDLVTVGQEACDDSIMKLLGDSSVDSDQEIAATKTQVETTHEPPQDLLLENVTNRTEALASQASTFNMFRTRLRSTLETE